MWRNIMAQSMFQIVVLLLLLTKGVWILRITEFDGKACNWTSEEYFVPNAEGHLEGTCKALHYTMVFHTFVFMQVFNEINSRKLGEREFNVFEGFFNNWLFQFIILLTIIVQILLVQYGGIPVRAVPLTTNQHIACIFIGALSILVGIASKFVPSEWFRFLKSQDKELSREEMER
jgi:magnesium-transporting ATPase (P-type)